MKQIMLLEDPLARVTPEDLSPFKSSPEFWEWLDKGRRSRERKLDTLVRALIGRGVVSSVGDALTLLHTEVSEIQGGPEVPWEDFEGRKLKSVHEDRILEHLGRPKTPYVPKSLVDHPACRHLGIVSHKAIPDFFKQQRLSQVNGNGGSINGKESQQQSLFPQLHPGPNTDVPNREVGQQVALFEEEQLTAWKRYEGIFEPTGRVSEGFLSEMRSLREEAAGIFSTTSAEGRPWYEQYEVLRQYTLRLVGMLMPFFGTQYIFRVPINTLEARYLWLLTLISWA